MNEQAEVIENSIEVQNNALSIDFESIQEDILEMNSIIEKVQDTITEDMYSDEYIRALDYKGVDENAKTLNALVKDYDRARISLKKKLTEPYKIIEEKGAELIEPLITLRDIYSERRKDLKQQMADEKRAELEQEYLEFAPALADVVPFEALLNPQWLNKSFKYEKAVDELTEKVSKVASEWESLKKLNLEYFTEAQAEFFRTLSLQAAIEYNDMRVAEQERIAQLEQEVHANREAMEATPYEEAASVPEIVAEAESYVQQLAAEPMRKRYLIEVDLSENEKHGLIGYMKAAGIHGEIKAMRG